MIRRRQFIAGLGGAHAGLHVKDPDGINVQISHS